MIYYKHGKYLHFAFELSTVTRPLKNADQTEKDRNTTA